MPASYFVDEVRLALLDDDCNANWSRRASDTSLSSASTSLLSEKGISISRSHTSAQNLTASTATTAAAHLLLPSYRKCTNALTSGKCERTPLRRRRVCVILMVLVCSSLGLYVLVASSRYPESVRAESSVHRSARLSGISLHDSDSLSKANSTRPQPSSVLSFDLHHDEDIDTSITAPSASAANRRRLYSVPAQAPLLNSELCLEEWISMGTVCDQLRGIYTEKPELTSIDILYSWVNGSDWRHASAKWMHAFRPKGRWQDYAEKDLFPTSNPPAPKAGPSKPVANWHKRDTAIESRFRDHEELRYAMRSATKHLKGLKTIHIIAPDYAAPYAVQVEAQSGTLSKRSPPFRLDTAGLTKAFRGLPSQLRRLQGLTTDRFITQDGQIREGQVPQWLSTSTSSNVRAGQEAESTEILSTATPVTVPQVRLHHDWNSFKNNWLITAPQTKEEERHQNDYRRLSLPTFNSMAVESMLGDEPGLGENFVYANDDFFFLNDASASDIITPFYGPVFRIDPNLAVDGRRSPKPAVGEWAALWHTNWLLDQRFGIRTRPYTIHVQKSFSKSLLMEARMTWATEHARLGLTRFRTGGDNLVTHFLAYYSTIERHREALLWSFFMLRLDQDGDGRVSGDEWRSALGQMGLSPETIDTVMVPAKPYAVIDLRVMVKLPKRRTLAKQAANGCLIKAGWPVPLNTRYVFSSQDGYPLADLEEDVIISDELSHSAHGKYASAAKRSEKLIAEWPDFVDEPSQHIWADHRFERTACTLDLGRCLTQNFPVAGTNTSWEDVFKQMAYSDPQCGDCLIHHLTGKSGARGIEAFLPPRDRVAGSQAVAHHNDGLDLDKVPHLPLATTWNATGPAKVGEAEAACFSTSCVLANSGYEAGSSLRLFAAKLIQRYSYVIGNSPVQFKQLENLPQSIRTFENLDRSLAQPSTLELLEAKFAREAHGKDRAVSDLAKSAMIWPDSQAQINDKRPVFVCINDDILERWTKSVGERLTRWLAKTWPDKQPWEV